jgi:hypothetical protein
MQPLCSGPITEPSSLVRVAPSLCLASVLRLLRDRRLSRSLHIKATGSQVPHLSLNQDHATFMPDAKWAVKQVASHSAPGLTTPPGFDVVPTLSTLHQRFTRVRLLDPYLTESSSAFSLTLTTRTLNPRSLRWFGACSCKPAPRGLPSSHMQHRFAQKKKTTGSAFMAHSRQHSERFWP